MDNILHRISKIAELQGVTISKIEQMIGASKGVLYKAIQKNTDIQSKWIVLIVENFPQYSPEWLLTGKGEMLKDDVEIQEKREVNSIPLVSSTAIGGFGNNVSAFTDGDIKEFYRIPKFDNKKVDFMIEVEGSSMYPKYNSGDIVACRIIRESSFIQWYKVHVVATKEQGILIKRIEEGSCEDNLKMVSDNDKYKPFEVPKEEITGLAFVVGVIRLE